MANTCFNTLTISGDSEAMAKIKNLIQQKEHQVVDILMTYASENVPLEETIAKQQSENPNALVYSKDRAGRTAICIEKTYTRKGFNLAGAMTKFYNYPVDEYVIDNDSLCYGYETGWGPADNLMEHMSEKYPSLVFNLKFSEDGCGVYGIETWQNGSLIESQYPENEWTETELRTWLHEEGLSEYEYGCPHCHCPVRYDEIEGGNECPECEEELPSELIA